MKTCRHLFLVLLPMVASLGLWAQPQIKFDVTDIDLGTIPQGAPADYVFGFMNVGNEPLILTSVKSSCGCVVPNWPKEIIAPGERGEVRAKYDSKRIGPCVKTVTVQSNDSLNPIATLKLRCNVFAIHQQLEFREVIASPFFQDVPKSDVQLEGGTLCRPCFPPPTKGQYVVAIHNLDSRIALIDLTTFNDPANGHFGIFLSDDVAPGSSTETLQAAWGTRCHDKYELQPDGNIYLVVHDRAWLEEHIFRPGLAQWAVPLGIDWRNLPSGQ